MSMLSYLGVSGSTNGEGTGCTITQGHFLGQLGLNHKLALAGCRADALSHTMATSSGENASLPSLVLDPCPPALPR
jgi:hypothetical protein